MMDLVREVYLNFKRKDNLAMGMTEEEAEANIQAYVQWQERKREWEASEKTIGRTCISCGRLISKTKTSAGVVCHLCFLTKDRCVYPGCKRLQRYKKKFCWTHSEMEDINEGEGTDNCPEREQN
jgi:hypothetical protein